MPAPSSISSVDSLVITCIVKIKGQQVNDAVGISSIKITHDINRISSAELSLITLTGKAADHGFIPGNTIEISAGYSAQSASALFTGVIVKNSMNIDSNSNYKWSVSCRHTISKMTVGKVKSNFADVTDSECITNLVNDKYPDISIAIKASTMKHEALVQNNATDWDFILSRTDFLGYIVCPDQDPIFIGPPVFTISQGVERIALGEAIISFNVEINAEKQPPTLTATAWDKSTGTDNTVTAAEPAFSSKMIQLPASFLTQPEKLNSSIPMTQSELQSWADGRLQRVRLSAYKGQVSIVGNGGIKTGNWVELAGVGDDYSGLIIVSAVSHTISKGSWKTNLKLGLEDAPAHEKANFSSPAAGGQLPGIQGMQRAVVKKLEQDPTKEFRIQIETQPNTADGKDNIWARIASHYATSAAGAFYMPELNDEVVVGFLENDPRYPIIMGSLYSSTNAAPVDVKDTNFIKMFCTKNKLKLTFDDDKKIITIETPGANKIVISDEAKSIEITDQNNNSVKMNSSGITLDSAKDISLTAKGDISLSTNSGKISISSSAGDVSISGNNVSQSANAAFKAEGNASAQVSSSGITTIKGSVVLIN